MDSLFRDVSRLGLISQLGIGQERFSLATHFSDFTHYYFSRFMINVKSAFKDFTTSEVRDFNNRHGAKIDLLVKYPALRMTKSIVPIPKGMIHPYRDTLDVLTNVLDRVNIATIKHDLEQILATMGTGKLKTLLVTQFDKKEFEEAKATIAKLFGKTGLSHSTVSHVLATPADVGYVNSNLLNVTNKCYPLVMELNPLLQKIETRFNQLKFNEQDKETLSSILMIMAYRLSILAVVADHLQSLEHGFVGSVDIILKNV